MHTKFKITLLFILAVVLVVGMFGISSAQSIAGSSWWTSFTIQNTNSGDTALVATAYTKMGQADTNPPTSSVIIPQNFSVIFNPGYAGNCGATATNGCRIGFTPDVPSGFEGAVVLSSDGPAVAVAQINNNKVGSVGANSGTARAGYQATAGTVAADTLYFPNVKNNFVDQSTLFFVQAAGEDVQATISYIMNDGQTYSEGPVSITANKMYVFSPSAAGVPACDNTGKNNPKCIGGATVTTQDSKKIAGTVVEYREGVSVAEYVLSTRGLTQGDTGQVVTAPTMKNDFFSSTTGASIFNSDESNTASVDLSFTVTNVESGCTANIGDVVTDTVSVGPRQSVVVSPFKNNIGGLPNCTFFVMTASTLDNGGENIAVTVNEARNSGSDTVKAVYTGFNTTPGTGNATDTVFIPLAKENFVNNTTGLTIVNASTAESTEVDVTYSGTTGTHVLRTINLASGQGIGLRQVFKGDPSKFSVVSGGLPQEGNKYSVIAEAVNSNAVIVGLAQEASVSGTVMDIFNLEGFNQ